jgi:hypothetical protein
MFGKHKLEVFDGWHKPEAHLTISRRCGELLITYDADYDSIDIDGMEYEGDTGISIPLEPFAAFMTEVAKMRAQRPSESEGTAT